MSSNEKKILVLDGNPKTTSLSHSISEAIVEAQNNVGRKVEYLRLSELNFDPNLIGGYQYESVQPFEPDLERVRRAVSDCNVLVIVYPTWWGGMPAKLKGLFDRAFTSGFAYKYHKKGPFWDKLLQGRSAYVVTTMDAPGWWYWLYYHNSSLLQFRKPILWFCGFSPIKTKIIDKVRFRTREDLAEKIKAVAQASLKI